MTLSDSPKITIENVSDGKECSDFGTADSLPTREAITRWRYHLLPSVMRALFHLYLFLLLVLLKSDPLALGKSQRTEGLLQVPLLPLYRPFESRDKDGTQMVLLVLGFLPMHPRHPLSLYTIITTTILSSFPCLCISYIVCNCERVTPANLGGEKPSKE
ncbi:hypothetical protein KQX54_020941 [Cotesia glomerata]|uniref:Uncharacterized protein n=1 Tax=Cotesia glomerata TaxID=32391 RepID=A0AAV7J609_COTGL|nr:hypothetical protein KQX54_020941 [Cotesia glomerata]